MVRQYLRVVVRRPDDAPPDYKFDIHGFMRIFLTGERAKMKLGTGLGAKPPPEEQAPHADKKAADIEIERGYKITGYEVTADPNGVSATYEGIDWNFIYKCSHSQFFLSMISSICLLISLHFTGFNVFRFTSSAWATYLACVSVVGIRAGKYRNYAYLVAYAGMVTFQTVIYMSSLCWLAYSLYALDYHVNYAFRGHYAASIISHDLAIALIIVEIVALLCTIFTGFFGLCAVCRGLGAMLQEVDGVLMDRAVPPPQITVRPLV
ncbi:hypothetical protein PMAYCL1PPCAC_00216 [Pristionchus mayeri]|uniref:Uncharacterized protein n=1 Tax=Pristionchus mayeri TaxID=1317129 RepID=A0AAN5C671_9BILA|nr:hypothetical protein PMAYCL1PPCAC_00216 [Pristionchus mayeri]